MTPAEYEIGFKTIAAHIKRNERRSKFLETGLFIVTCIWIGLFLGLKLELFYIAGYVSLSLFKFIADFVINDLFPFNGS